MQEFETKKSAVDLTDMAIGIIVLGIVVSIGAIILVNYRDAQEDVIPSATTANESITTVNEQGDVLAATKAAVCYKSTSICINETNVVIAPGNYTVTKSLCSATIKTTAAVTAPYNDTTYKCTYTGGNASDPRWALANNASVGIGEYGNWFKIIVIVAVATVVLALLFMAFGRGSMSGGGGIGGTY